MQNPHREEIGPGDSTLTFLDRRERARGQSLVEFSLVLPIILFILLGILDVSRVFTAVVSVESAVREAAEYGAFSSDYWDESDVSDPARDKTETAMKQRVCLASSTLPDYIAESDPALDPCSNPRITKLELVNESLSPATGCADAARNPGPCWVLVELEYRHDIIAPIGFDFFGTRIGLDDELVFRREAIFAISDFTTDLPS